MGRARGAAACAGAAGGGAGPAGEPARGGGGRCAWPLACGRRARPGLRRHRRGRSGCPRRRPAPGASRSGMSLAGSAPGSSAEAGAGPASTGALAPAGLAAGSVPTAPPPEGTAASVLTAVTAPGAPAPEPAPAASASAIAGAPHGAPVPSAGSAAAGQTPAAEPSNPSAARGLTAADPRALWAGCLLLSAGIFSQSSVAALALSIGVTAGVTAYSGVPVRSLKPAVRPFLLLMAFSVAISGARIAFPAGFPGMPAIAFSVPEALLTLRQFVKLLCVLVLGMLLPLLAGPIRMKQGLEQGLAGLSRLKLPVEAVALTASLLFRFIPLILAELERFSRIARARGRSGARPGSLRARDLPAVLIPLLVSLFKSAEDFALALEMRGYDRLGPRRPLREPLRFSRSDYRLIAVSLLGFVVLIGAGRL
ncbi:hypothetical protein N6H14_15860 [Paenibacillus sp. CC-CFT747]|nr:hypothetical protein N6H14_15860 [Paenibacillus sp. CC-CFT747]